MKYRHSHPDHCVRDLRHNEPLTLGARNLFDLDLAADADLTGSGPVDFGQLILIDDNAARREIRSLHDVHQLFIRKVLIPDQSDGRVDDLTEIVRRNACRHADGDAFRAVHEQIRNPRRQHDGFLLRLIEVRDKVHDIPVEI